MQKEPDRNPRKVLGKGLSALLPNRQHPGQPISADGDTDNPAKFGCLQSIPLQQIEPNQEQPRTAFHPERLEDLAKSLRANGLLQPITVHKIGSDQYRLIAGERRWRAAALAGFTEIPAIVRSVEQHQLLELALIENIQREDLNPIEVALAFQSLAENHGLQHDQIAERTGKDRSTITNFLRLLRLSSNVQRLLIEGKITAGHARALVNVPEAKMQETLCQQIVDEQLTVRQVERMVKEINGPQSKSSRAKSPQTLLEDGSVGEAPAVDPNIKAALDEMAMSLGTRITLRIRTPTSGKLEIEYYSQEDLDRIYSVITKQ